MPTGRPLTPLTLDHEQRSQLTAWSRSTTKPHALVQRAQVILASAAGLSNKAVAAQVGLSPNAVGKWRRCFLEAGVTGLHDEPRPGRPRIYDDEKVATLINHALQERPDNATHGSVRSLAEAQGVSKSTVHRWFTRFGVKPRPARHGASRARSPGPPEEPSI